VRTLGAGSGSFCSIFGTVGGEGYERGTTKRYVKVVHVGDEFCEERRR
jgi:hypothetical protein